MPQVAFVTRTFASRTFQTQSPENVGNETGVGYTLRTAAGQNLGSYRSVSEAQAAFARRYGPNRILKWQQQNLRGDIEQHVAIGLPLDPSEIWQDALIEWISPSLIPGSIVLQSVSLATIQRASDLSGSGNQAVQTTLAQQPTLVASDAGFNDRASIQGSGAQQLLVPSITTLTPPYTIIAVARATVDIGGDVVFVDTGGDDLILGGNGAGVWELVVGGTSLFAVDTPPISSAAVLTVQVTDTESVFRLNGATQGTIAGVPDANGTVTLLNALDFLIGRLADVMIATGETEPNDTRILQTERYYRERYQ